MQSLRFAHSVLSPSFPSLPSYAQGTLETERKFSAGENKSSHRGHMNMKKLDDETEEFQRKWTFFHLDRFFLSLISFLRSIVFWSIAFVL